MRKDVSPESVLGMMSPKEGDLLRRMAQRVPPGGLIVELGSLFGRSTMYLAQGAGEGVKVITVAQEEENWGQLKDTINRFNADDVVRPLLGSTSLAAEMWSGEDPLPPIDVLLIDADHSFEGTEENVLLFCPHVKPEGVVLFHDFTDYYPIPFPGVPKCVGKYFPAWEQDHIECIHSLVALPRSSLVWI